MPGQWPHWLSSGTPAWTMVRRFGRKKSLTVQSKLPVPRSPLTSQVPGMTSTSARGNRPRQNMPPSSRRRGWPSSRILEAAEHPGGFMTAAAEGPAAAHAIAALDRHGLAAALHRGAGDHGAMAFGIDLLHAVVGQAERDQRADTVVGDVPADRARGFGQELDDADVGQRIGLQAVKARRVHLLDQRGRQPLLALDLVVVVPHGRLERGGRLHHRLGIDLGRQAAHFDDGLHRHLL